MAVIFTSLIWSLFAYFFFNNGDFHALIYQNFQKMQQLIPNSSEDVPVTLKHHLRHPVMFR